MKKRILSILLCLCMALTLLPVSALAVEENTDGYAVGTSGKKVYFNASDNYTVTNTSSTNNSFTFSIQPAEGYVITCVAWGNTGASGIGQPLRDSYTISSITADKAVTVTAVKEYIVNVTVGAGELLEDAVIRTVRAEGKTYDPAAITGIVIKTAPGAQIDTTTMVAPRDPKNRDRTSIDFTFLRDILNNLSTVDMCDATLENDTIPYCALCDTTSTLTEFVFPSNLKIIGKGAFNSCFILKGPLDFPNTLTEIGDLSFTLCYGLTGQLVLPSSLKKIGYQAFLGCAGITGSLTFPEGFESVASMTFFNCSGLTGNLILPKSVIRIGDKAFQSCSKIDGSIIIPNLSAVIDSDNTFSSQACSEFVYHGPSAYGPKLNTNNLIRLDVSGSGYSGTTGTLDLSAVTKLEYFDISNCANLTGALTVKNNAGLEDINLVGAPLSSADLSNNRIDFSAGKSAESLAYLKGNNITPTISGQQIKLYPEAPAKHNYVIETNGDFNINDTLPVLRTYNGTDVTTLMDGNAWRSTLASGETVAPSTWIDNTALPVADAKITQTITDPNGKAQEIDTSVAGTWTITYTNEASGLNETYTVNVVEAAPTYLTVTGAGALAKGEYEYTMNSTYGAAPATLSVTDASGAVTWASSVPSVATVSDGIVTPVSAGTTYITVTDSKGISAYINVVVAPADPELTLPETITRTYDGTAQIITPSTKATSYTVEFRAHVDGQAPDVDSGYSTAGVKNVGVYDVRVKTTDPNYLPTIKYATLTIKKYTPVLTVTRSTITKPETGKNQTFSVTCSNPIPTVSLTYSYQIGGVSVNNSTGWTTTDPGEYTIIATFKPTDTANVEATTASLTFTITNTLTAQTAFTVSGVPDDVDTETEPFQLVLKIEDTTYPSDAATYTVTSGSSVIVSTDGLVTPVSVGNSVIRVTRPATETLAAATTDVVITVRAAAKMLDTNGLIINNNPASGKVELVYVNTVTDTQQRSLAAAVPDGLTADTDNPFTISLYQDGKLQASAALNRSVSVTVPYPVQANTIYHILHLKSDASTELLPTTADVAAQTLSFEVSSFSPFMVLTKDAPVVNYVEPAPKATEFTDVQPDAYYYNSVLWAVKKGITEGTSATTFSPDAACTRAQAVTLLWRATGSPEPVSTTSPFTDVKADTDYYKAVLWAVERGVTEGTGATSFSPNETVTRAQAVTFLWRAAGNPKPTSTLCPFTDVKTDAYFHNAVLWAVEKGITEGTSTMTFSPEANCTRAQIVTFLYRQLGK